MQDCLNGMFWDVGALSFDIPYIGDSKKAVFIYQQNRASITWNAMSTLENNPTTLPQTVTILNGYTVGGLDQGVSGISGPGRLLQVGNLARLPIFFMGFRLDLAFVGAEVEEPRVAWEDPPQTPQTRRAPVWRICAAARPVRSLR